MKIQVDDERIAFILNKLNVEMHGGQLLFNDKNRPEQLVLTYRPDDFEVDALGIQSISNSLNYDVNYDMNVLLDGCVYYFILKDIRQIKTGSSFCFDIVYDLYSCFDVSDSRSYEDLQSSGVYENISENKILSLVQEGKVLA